jgi:UrcA family protein
MNTVHFKVAAATAALAFMAGSVMAQSASEVNVQATRNVNTKVVGHSSSGVPIVNLSLTYGVSLAGLDLSTNSGANEAAKRVSDAAMAACKEISLKYRDATPSDSECAKAASDKAMIQVREMVASAQKARPQG